MTTRVAEGRATAAKPHGGEERLHAHERLARGAAAVAGEREALDRAAPVLAGQVDRGLEQRAGHARRRASRRT